ncbi:retrovirus-related pol polyprotein from transposon TNT 1-94 [Tanacetum coccineum]|uniref:Retrovirus-related pol polyprotein from transposon TNT 1-94 n=1 Tax=Tanacetum coccineum TaxID=301880 RepID=A0ABQ5HPY6_9ASTR
MILGNDGVVSKTTTKDKVKSLALKAKVTREKTGDDSDSQDGSDEDVDEEEEDEAFNLMSRNFHKFFRKGHFASECRKPKENNAFIRGAWSDSEDGDVTPNTRTVLEKRSLENEKSKLVSKANDLELEVKKLVNDKEVFDGGHAIFGSNLKGKVVDGGQLCDDDCVVRFTKVDFTISKDGKMLAKGHRRNGLYTCKLGDNSKQQIRLACVMDNSTLWHRRLGHANMRIVQNLASNELVRNLPKLSFEKHFCDTYGLGSQGNANNRTRKEVSITKVLELLHLNLFGPSSIKSYRDNFYTLIIIDDHSNYTWVVFVKSKEDVLEKFKTLCKKLENLHDCSIVSIITNHSSEFDKLQFGSFYEQHGMSYNLSGSFTS